MTEVREGNGGWGGKVKVLLDRVYIWSNSVEDEITENYLKIPEYLLHVQEIVSYFSGRSKAR